MNSCLTGKAASCYGTHAATDGCEEECSHSSEEQGGQTHPEDVERFHCENSI